MEGTTFPSIPDRPLPPAPRCAKDGVRGRQGTRVRPARHAPRRGRLPRPGSCRGDLRRGGPAGRQVAVAVPPDVALAGGEGAMAFIVEVTTKTGKVCESYETYEEAKRRVDQLPADSLAGIPFIFRELADGSQRLGREDGKPLQGPRLPEAPPPGPDEPIPLSEDPVDLRQGMRVIGPEAEEEAPIPLSEGSPDLRGGLRVI